MSELKITNEEREKLRKLEAYAADHSMKDVVAIEQLITFPSWALSQVSELPDEYLQEVINNIEELHEAVLAEQDRRKRAKE